MGYGDFFSSIIEIYKEERLWLHADGMVEVVRKN